MNKECCVIWYEEEGLASMLGYLAELPPANKDTLAYIILHLQK